jgi:hypothetical protein
LIRVRVTSAVVSALLLALCVVVLVGCATSSSPASPGQRSASSARADAVTPLAPLPAPTGLARTDPALWAAVQFERAHCAWNWHQTRQAYVAGQQALATASYGRQVAAASDPVSWRDQVMGQKQTVICIVSDAVRDLDAPTTGTAVYVRMSVNTQITSTLGTFAGGEQIASWLVVRTAAGWQVAGSFEGG